MNDSLKNAARVVAGAMIGEPNALQIMLSVARDILADSADASCAFSAFKGFAEETARVYCEVLAIKPKANQLFMSAAQKAGKKGQTLYSYSLWIGKAIAQSKHQFLEAGTKAKQLQEEFSAKRKAPGDGPGVGDAEGADSAPEGEETSEESSALPTIQEVLQQILLTARAGLMSAENVESVREIAQACGFVVVNAPVTAPIVEDVAPAAVH